MRIIYIGAVDTSVAYLEAVLGAGGDIVGVFTLPPELGRKLHSNYVDLKPIAHRYGIPFYHVAKTADPTTLELIEGMAPDIILVWGWSQLIPRELVRMPPLGCIGVHPALLPKHRGRHPVIWSLVEGLDKGGLTFFYLDEGADSGDILCQRSFPISPDDDAASVLTRITELGCKMIGEFLPLLQSGHAPRRPQDHSQATYWRKRTKEDGTIRWCDHRWNIYNLVRALTHPYPGAMSTFEGVEVIIWRACRPDLVGAEYDDRTSLPGQITARDERGWYVKCGDGVICLTDIFLANKELYVGGRFE